MTVITPAAAAQVLYVFSFGKSPGAKQPGSFYATLIELCQLADRENSARILASWPGIHAAVTCARQAENGLPFLELVATGRIAAQGLLYVAAPAAPGEAPRIMIERYLGEADAQHHAAHFEGIEPWAACDWSDCTVCPPVLGDRLDPPPNPTRSTAERLPQLLAEADQARAAWRAFPPPANGLPAWLIDARERAVNPWPVRECNYHDGVPAVPGGNICAECVAYRVQAAAEDAARLAEVAGPPIVVPADLPEGSYLHVRR